MNLDEMVTKRTMDETMDTQRQAFAHELNAQAWRNQADELDWLMSLALDGQLDDQDALRLEALLESEAHSADWRLWQTMDTDLRSTPSVMPRADFVTNFETRLAQWERRRKLRTGVIFGLLAMVLWCSALVGVVGMGAFFWSSQVTWLSALIHQFAYTWTVVQQIGASVVSSVDVLLAAPQTWMAFACYVVVAVGILSGWFMWLRRSLRLESATYGS